MGQLNKFFFQVFIILIITACRKNKNINVVPMPEITYVDSTPVSGIAKFRAKEVYFIYKTDENKTDSIYPKLTRILDSTLKAEKDIDNYYYFDIFFLRKSDKYNRGNLLKHRDILDYQILTDYIAYSWIKGKFIKTSLFDNGFLIKTIEKHY